MQFLAVYVREAHPTDGWRSKANDLAGITIKQPTTFEERTGVAQRCCSTLKMTMPLVVDHLDDRVGHAYSGMPDRLYIIDRQGRVAYKGGRGPFGFNANEMEQSLIMLLLDQKTQPKKKSARVPLLTNNEAWAHLPRAEKGLGKKLPAWARALARSLPRTTAAMLELDYLHRVRSPLDPLLRGTMRWVAADANGCAYTRLQAEGDLLRAGLKKEKLADLRGDFSGLAPAERQALIFAKKMSVAANTVTDAEVEGLIQRYGEKQVTAMVLLLAYANFQDRLLLSLGITPEIEPPQPPLAVRFAHGPEATTLLPAAPRFHDGTSTASEHPKIDLPQDWQNGTFAALQKRLEQQRGRKPRIRVPTWEELQKRFPKRRGRPVRIKWSLVCYGYQPELAMGWSRCTGAFRREAKQDRVFEESLFWVVTRTLNCFY